MLKNIVQNQEFNGDYTSKSQTHYDYDVTVIGMGPAGAMAAVYLRRAGLSVAVVEGSADGGQVSLTEKIDNCIGFTSIEGWELATKLGEQVRNCGATVIYGKAVNAMLTDEAKIVETSSKKSKSITSRAVIICGGSRRRKLGLDGEERLVGRGVSYCAVCDGNFYKEKIVAVVGGGETALGDALYLSRIARKVILIHRRDAFRASRSKLAQLDAAKNIDILTNSRVTGLETDSTGKLCGIAVEQICRQNDENVIELHKISVEGLFIAIGSEPDSELYKGQIELDENGFIVTDESMRTSVRGVFAAGDIRRKALRQIVTAASDGAIAAVACAEELSAEV